MSQNPKADYAAIIRENQRIAEEADRKYRHMIADHERQLAMITVEAQIVVQRAILKGMQDALRPKTRRVTVAM